MTTYHKGQWNACCDRCATIKLSSELRKEWTGLRVCRECFDIRNPQDLKRGIPDNQTIPWARPEPEPIYLSASYTREDGSIMFREGGGNLPLLRET